MRKKLSIYIKEGDEDMLVKGVKLLSEDLEYKVTEADYLRDSMRKNNKELEFKSKLKALENE